MGADELLTAKEISDAQGADSPAETGSTPRDSTPALGQLDERQKRSTVPGYCNTGISTVLHKWWQHSNSNSAARSGAQRSNTSSRPANDDASAATPSSDVQLVDLPNTQYQPASPPHGSSQRRMQSEDVEFVDLTLDDTLPRALPDVNQSNANPVLTGDQQQAEVQEGNAEW
jgi:hypothetical protein